MKRFIVRIGLGIVMGGLLLGGLLANQARATDVTFNFKGLVTNVGSQLSGGPFSDNQAVMGSYTFNPNTSNTGSGFTGTYNGAVKGLNVTIGTYVASLAAGAIKIEVKNNLSLSADSYKVEGLFSGSSVTANSYKPKSFELQLEKLSDNQFNGVLLPSTPPSVSSFAETDRTFRLVFENGGNSRTVIVNLGTLAAVPLPTAVILFGAGLIALVGLGAGSWRQRKNSLA